MWNREQGTRHDLKPSHHVLQFRIHGSEFPAHPFLFNGFASW